VVVSVWATLVLTLTSGFRYVTQAAELLRAEPEAGT